METVTVGLGDRAYNILIGHGCLGDLGSAVKNTGLSGRCVVVTNPTVAALYLERTVNSLTNAGFSVSVCELPDGERYKNTKTIGTIYDHLLEVGLDRSGFIVALGGGVIGDMAGFAAATFLRGIPFVQVPTTVVAQVDSSVGGKTGVNHPKGKNLIGAFYQPKLVFMDMEVLSTLPERELLAGIAEVVKYGVIADRPFFDYLAHHVERILNLDPPVMAKVVGRCCELKAQVVAEDERETSGRRAILNYGHTVGHAIEAVTKYKKYKHGEAVAIGMIAASRIARDLGRLSAKDVDTQVALLKAFGLPVAVPKGLDRNAVIAALGHDKKASQGKVKMVLADSIGQVQLVPLSPNQIGDLLFGTAGATGTANA
jgi:3-dehydroquinate synthase